MLGTLCRKICGLFMMIALLAIGIYFMVSFAQPYEKYTKFYKIDYPDSMGILGGGLFGFFPPEKPLSPKKGQPARSTVTLENGALRLDLAITILLICNKKWQFRHTY